MGSGALIVSSVGRAMSLMRTTDKIVDEAQLLDYRWSDDEGVQVRLTHAAVEAVEGEGER